MSEQIRRWTIGADPISIRNPCAAGRIYMVHLYDVDANPIASPHESIHLLWIPQTERGACVGRLRRRVALQGDDYYRYSTDGTKPLLRPRYDLDLAYGFLAPTDGELLIGGGEEYEARGASIYVSCSWRYLRRGEAAPRWRYTVWGDEDRYLTAPKGASGVSSPDSATVTVECGTTTRTFKLPTDGSAWPLLGARKVKRTTAGPLSWEISP